MRRLILILAALGAIAVLYKARHIFTFNDIDILGEEPYWEER